jgi:hypothetical protein
LSTWELRNHYRSDHAQVQSTRYGFLLATEELISLACRWSEQAHTNPWPRHLFHAKNASGASACRVMRPMEHDGAEQTSWDQEAALFAHVVEHTFRSPTSTGICVSTTSRSPLGLQWTRRRTSNPKIAGSSPAGGVFLICKTMP